MTTINNNVIIENYNNENYIPVSNNRRILYNGRKKYYYFLIMRILYHLPIFYTLYDLIKTDNYIEPSIIFSFCIFFNFIRLFILSLYYHRFYL